ncbi:UNVERIFIED_CONTAM: hypothetical protein Sangu_3118000 [Sesamum angustifolium]|uniref:Uncharacterized protein n=1 Tax=Sesamum angustifolium TaxID=2727405 RepID=A0AAW2K2D3_9LAMI
MSWVLGQNLFSSRTHVGSNGVKVLCGRSYSLRPYLPVLASPADVTTGSGTFTVLESAPSYAHVVASAATRNLRSPAMEKDLLLSMP